MYFDRLLTITILLLDVTYLTQKNEHAHFQPKPTFNHTITLTPIIENVSVRLVYDCLRFIFRPNLLHTIIQFKLKSPTNF